MRVSGVVKFFSRVRGWGFITPDEVGAEVFVHYSAIDGRGYRNLYEGDRVSFEVVDEGRGPEAREVRVERWQK